MRKNISNVNFLLLLKAPLLGNSWCTWFTSHHWTGKMEKERKSHFLASSFTPSTSSTAGPPIFPLSDLFFDFSWNYLKAYYDYKIEELIGFSPPLRYVILNEVFVLNGHRNLDKLTKLVIFWRKILCTKFVSFNSTWTFLQNFLLNSAYAEF